MTRLLRYLFLILAHIALFPATRVSVVFFLMLLTAMIWDFVEQKLKRACP